MRVFWDPEEAGMPPLNRPKPKQHLPSRASFVFCAPFDMKTDIHPKYEAAEFRCACGNVITTRSTRRSVLLGLCNACHPFYTGQQKFVDTAGRVDKFQQRAAKTVAAQAAVADAAAAKKKKK
jgi:large subunit ribosomal protein L31